MKLRSVRLVSSAPSPSTGRELTHFESRDHEIDLKADTGLIRIGAKDGSARPALIVHASQTRFMLEARADVPTKEQAEREAFSHASPRTASVAPLQASDAKRRARDTGKGQGAAKAEAVDSGPAVPEAG